MRKIVTMVAVAAAGVVVGEAGAAERVQCRSDGPFGAEVHESRVRDGRGPATLLARLAGAGTISCTNGLTGAPLHIEQSLALIEQYGHAGPCLNAGSGPSSGKAHGRTELTMTITTADGARQQHLQGLVDGVLQRDEHNPDRCLIDLAVRAHAPNGTRLTLQLTGLLDRTTGTLTNTLFSASEVDTY